MNWLHIIAEGVWIYGALFAVALVITYHTHARQRARRIKKCGNTFWRDSVK
jgi:putative copper export protein